MTMTLEPKGKLDTMTVQAARPRRLLRLLPVW
jgi:hypothetical protein